MIAKITAVEWLVNELDLDMDLDSKWIIEKAKEMEKQQIIDAYHINPLESEWQNIGIDYYNETFKLK